MLSDLDEITNEIIKLAREVDNNINVLNDEVHGLQIIPDFALILEHEFLKRGPLPQRYIMRYDYLMLILAELGLIRSVRYIGRVSRLRYDTTLKIRKLKIQRDETSKLGQELIGSFITQGQVEVESNCALQGIYPVLLNLIRPLTRIKFYMGKAEFAAVFPTHLSLTLLPVYENQRKDVFLSPSSMLTLIDYTRAYEKTVDILGYKNIRSLISRGYVISCRPTSFIDSVTMHTDIIKCTSIGPYKVIIPLIDRVNENLRERYYDMQEIVLTNLLGIWIFEEKPFILDSDLKSYLLALDETPYMPEVEVFAIFGEPTGIPLDRLKMNLRLSRDSTQTLSNDHNKLMLYTNIRVSKKYINEYNEKIKRLIHFLLSEKGFKARDQIPSSQITSRKTHEYYACVDDHCYMYTPPILSLLSGYLGRDEVLEALNLLDEYGKKSSVTPIEIYGLMSKPNVKRIIDSGNFMRLWYSAFKGHRDLVYGKNLGILI